MNYAKIKTVDIANGTGVRVSLFVSGCNNNCQGCFNKEAQDFNYGEEFNEEEILKRIKENSILNGITISGGEPLCKENIPGVLKFIKDVKEIRPEFNVWCYSGYTLDQLIDRNDEETNECLNQIDVLVDGRFVEAKKDPTLKFRGSSNQRILDLKPSLQTHKFIEYKL